MVAAKGVDGHLFSGPAIRVAQPLGEFWVASIPARLLLQATEKDPLRLIAEPEKSGWSAAGTLGGTQRALERPRLLQISSFLNTFEATFPNSIILSVEEESSVEDGGAWRIEPGGTGGCAKLTIPRDGRKARVVDGQHRLYAFSVGAAPADFDLLCAVFFGLADPMQAYIFATINTNQKPVRRGLAMNLYGYNVEDQTRSEWSPEKLAVFMARRLNFENDSPLHRRVKIEAEGAPSASALPAAKRPIPMAAVVDAALGLVTRNPKRDRDLLRARTTVFSKAKRKALPSDDDAPLRAWYLEEADADVYDLLKRYFSVVREQLWSDSHALLTRAVDIRALGDFLGDLVRVHSKAKHAEAIGAVAKAGEQVFAKAKDVEFGDPFFEANYRGRRRVQFALRMLWGQNVLDQVPPEDRPHYERLVRGKKGVK